MLADASHWPRGTELIPARMISEANAPSNTPRQRTPVQNRSIPMTGAITK